jgi:hypothetical protein
MARLLNRFPGIVHAPGFLGVVCAPDFRRRVRA